MIAARAIGTGDRVLGGGQPPGRTTTDHQDLVLIDSIDLIVKIPATVAWTRSGSPSPGVAIAITWYQ